MNQILGDIMKIKRILLSLAVVFGLTSFGSVANAACGNITIANMNWASANFMAEVDKIILEEGYGCSVELVPGATMPTFTSMQEKGELTFFLHRCKCRHCCTWHQFHRTSITFF